MEKQSKLKKYAKAVVERNKAEFGGRKCADCGSRNIIPFAPELGDVVMGENDTIHFTVTGTPWCGDCKSFNIVDQYIRVEVVLDK